MLTLNIRKVNFYTLSNVWFLILLLSFSYDKPIVILTSMDRFNPRLIDVATILGVIWYIKANTRFKIHNAVFNAYKKLIIWFAVCAFLGILLYGFPISVNVFSIYYLVKYFQELLVCHLVLCYLSVYNVPYDKIFKVLILGGVFVSLYCVQEYFTQNTLEVEISPGKYVIKPSGYVWGPFTVSYFQIANYSPVVGFLALTYAISKKGLQKWMYMATSLLIFWPSLVSGSRTAIGFIIMLFAIAFIKDIKFRGYIIITLLAVLLFFIFNTDAFYNLFLNSESETLQRFQRFEESGSHNSIEGRLRYVFEWFYRFGSYVYYGLFVPLFGAGFYVAPMNGVFRIGYGWHNIFIFAIEQAGVIGLLFFLNFIKKGYKALNNRYKTLKDLSVEKEFVFAVLVIFIGIFLFGISGAHTFWEGFSTGNFNLFRLVLIMLALNGFNKSIRYNYGKNITSK